MDLAEAIEIIADQRKQLNKLYAQTAVIETLYPDADVGVRPGCQNCLIKDKQLVGLKRKQQDLGQQIHAMHETKAAANRSEFPTEGELNGYRRLSRAQNAINNLITARPVREQFQPEHQDWLMILRDEIGRLRTDANNSNKPTKKEPKQ